ncbi:hypothetical protein L798_13877 [Zootermopsis nevadensis]|uniref:Uncharacterized protein n=1 Tax=Zootermopsis nevadensis TaxID=136037 RepID=A0A067RIU9_ZOONE|nr:hypothetical protein L798_13877 [Zootermopsis nevadensis]
MEMPLTFLRTIQLFLTSRTGCGCFSLATMTTSLGTSTILLWRGFGITLATEESESDVLPAEKCFASSLTDGSTTGTSASKSRSDETVLPSLGAM